MEMSVGQAQNEWYSNVNGLTNFLATNYTNVVHLDSLMESFTNPASKNLTQSLYILYGPSNNPASAE